MRGDFILSALRIIEEGKLDEARRFLEEILAGVPPLWKAAHKREDHEVVYSWSSEEFVAYSDFRSRAGAQAPIAWSAGSYTHGYYLLAWMESERRDHRGALQVLESALSLEPDHPDVLCLKAFLLRQTGCVEEAVATYRLALTMRPWATKAQQARAWRGLGGSLIDLERLAEAETALQQSLALAPESRMAMSELDYIREMLSGAEQRAAHRF